MPVSYDRHAHQIFALLIRIVVDGAYSTRIRFGSVQIFEQDRCRGAGTDDHNVFIYLFIRNFAAKRIDEYLGKAHRRVHDGDHHEVEDPETARHRDLKQHRVAQHQGFDDKTSFKNVKQFFGSCVSPDAAIQFKQCHDGDGDDNERRHAVKGIMKVKSELAARVSHIKTKRQRKQRPEERYERVAGNHYPYSDCFAFSFFHLMIP